PTAEPRPLAYLENSLGLACAARRLFTAALAELLLPLRDIGQNRPQSLVLDNGGLVDLPHLVEDAIGQFAALVFDDEAPVRIVENHHALTGEGTRDLIRLENEQHLVVLQRQAVGDRALFFPGESVVEIIILGERPVNILVAE